jgi:hypothetical protein
VETEGVRTDEARGQIDPIDERPGFEELGAGQDRSHDLDLPDRLDHSVLP